MTRGKRLQELRDHFGVTQDFVAHLAGLKRSTIGKIEKDIGDWKSAEWWRGLARAYGLTVEQLEQYIDGQMPKADAIRLASPRIYEARSHAEHEGKHEEALAKIFAKAEEAGPLYPGTKEFARNRLSDTKLSGPVVSYVAQVRAWSDTIERAFHDRDRGSSSRIPSR